MSGSTIYDRDSPGTLIDNVIHSEFRYDRPHFSVHWRLITRSERLLTVIPILLSGGYNFSGYYRVKKSFTLFENKDHSMTQ